MNELEKQLAVVMLFWCAINFSAWAGIWIAKGMP